MGNAPLRKMMGIPPGLEASTAHGVICCQCKIMGPPANRADYPFDACNGNPDYRTRCYWIKTKEVLRYAKAFQIAVSETGRLVGDVDESTQFKIEKGEKIVLYMRLYKEKGKYYCNECFAMAHPEVIKSIMLELEGKARFVSAKSDVVLVLNKTIKPVEETATPTKHIIGVRVYPPDHFK